MIVKTSTDKIWWNGNITDDKPNIELFENIKTRMTETDINVNYVNDRVIEVVVKNMDITYIHINHSSYDWYYFFDKVVRILNNGFLIRFKLDLYTTFTLKTITKLYTDNVEVNIERTTKNIPGFEYLKDELLDAVPYEIEAIKTIKQNYEFTNMIAENTIIYFPKTYNADYTHYGEGWNAKGYCYLGSGYKADWTRAVNNDNLYGVFYNPDICDEGYIFIPLFGEVDITAGNLESPEMQQNKLTVNLNSPGGLTPGKGWKIYENGNKIRYMWTSEITGTYKNTLETVQALSSKVYGWTGEHFIGIYRGPNWHKLGHPGNASINLAGMKLSNIAGDEHFRNYHFFFFTMNITTGKQVGCYVDKGYVIDSYKEYVNTLYGLLITTKFEGVYHFRYCDIDITDKKPIQPYLHYYYNAQRINPLIEFKHTHDVYFNNGFISMTRETPYNYQIYNYGNQYINLSDKYSQYVIANKQSWDTSLSLAKQNAIIGGVFGGLGAGLGVAQIAAGGDIFKGAGGILSGVKQMTSSILGYEQTKQKLAAQQHAAKATQGAEVRSSFEKDIQWVGLTWLNQGLADVVVYEQPTENTLKTFNYLLEHFGIYNTVWVNFKDIYNVNDYVEKAKYFYFKLTSNVSNILLKIIPDNIPNEYIELIYNDLTGGLRLWNTTP